MKLDRPLKCCGCGEPSYDGVKPCDCATMCGWHEGANGSVWFISREQAAHTALAELIETRLIGVRPDDQDIELDDEDWTRICQALRSEGERR